MATPLDQTEPTKFTEVNLLVITLLMIGGIVGLAWWYTREQDGRGITAENAAKIVKGMSQRDVISILGCDPGWYFGTNHKGGKVFYSRSHRPTPVLWMNSPNGITIAVYFVDQVVTSVEVIHSPPNNEPNPKKWPTEWYKYRDFEPRYIF